MALTPAEAMATEILVNAVSVLEPGAVAVKVPPARPVALELKGMA